MYRQRHRQSFLATAALALVASACGGAPPCSGVELGGACWTADEGITLSEERVSRIYLQAGELWGQPGGLEDWSIRFTHRPIEVAGTLYDGYCWPGRRVIIANPRGGQDCIENSFVFHEIGHAWGFGHDDLRMFHEWYLMDEAADASGWPGCRPAPR
jgi:hypothetical protein